MKKNMGQTDRWVRIVFGVVLTALLFVVQSGWRWLGLIGIALLATAYMNFCPLYALFGWSTNKDKNNIK